MRKSGLSCGMIVGCIPSASIIPNERALRLCFISICAANDSGGMEFDI